MGSDPQLGSLRVQEYIPHNSWGLAKAQLEFQ
jgi:hypothetical protein